MMINKYIQSFLICLALTSISIGCLENDDVFIVNFDEVYVDAEIADSVLSRSKGLMFRDDTLGEKEGMFFVFEREDHHKFWMKNMNFPIDIIWIDENMSVVHIEQNVPPCNDGDCPLYTSSKPAKYVLEVKANFTQQNNIKVDDRVYINRSF